ncbi:MAG: hypothetical protein KIG62_10940 [Oscillospiraceae bacterium]|nr:hypothetical protein [Oscillospiraceae bacterium]
MDKYEHRKAKTIITLTDKNGRRLCGEKVTACREQTLMFSGKFCPFKRAFSEE